MNWLKEYIASPTHKWFVDNLWRPSWTRLWSAISGIPSALIVAGQYISKLAGDDKIDTLLQKMHMPDGVFTALAIAALVTYVAHGRK